MEFSFNNKNREIHSSYRYALFAAIMLLVITWAYFIHWWNTSIFLLMGVIFGLYMAVNMWANDVANNMWPAVWSKALTLWWAIIIAAIFEAAWAMIAGWDVVETIKKWIINWSSITDTTQFLAIMLATLLWASIWINIATFFKAPVSTTQSIIGWLIWAWITAKWFAIVTWSKVWAIVASWIISPLMWWTIAVILMISIRHNILKKDDRNGAAKKWLPFYVGLMAWVFTTYLLLKWLKNVLNNVEIITPTFSVFVWLIVATIVYIALSFYLKKETALFKNSKKAINKLFNIPLIFAVALLSFAHWSNDVANAIWPLAAIYDIVTKWWVNIWATTIAPWVMIVWAVWLSVGLMTFWGRLIKTVWNEITKLNQTRAYAVALSAAITVMVASALWLPVSSTNIAIGWIFGIWLLTKYIKRNKKNKKEYIKMDMIKTIVLAWIITLPISWVIASITYLVIMKLN